MKLRLAAAVLAFVIFPAALFAAEATFDRTLPLNGPAHLNIHTGSGYIHITPGPDGSIHIVGHIHAYSSWFGGSAEERAREAAAHPPIEQNGNSIEVGRHAHYHDVAIDYVVTVPHGTAVEATSGSGDINVSNLGAPLTAKVDSGNIDANDLAGNVALTSGSGDIRAMMNHANTVRAGTGSGNIRLWGVTGGLYAETGSGNIEVDGQPGASWRLALESGSVTINTGGHARFTLDALTGSGSIHSDPPLVPRDNSSPSHVIGDIYGGGPTVHIQTGSGNIQIH